MIAIVSFALLALAGVVGSVVAVARDGYRPVPVRRAGDHIRPA